MDFSSLHHLKLYPLHSARTSMMAAEMMAQDHDHDDEGDTSVITKTKPKTKKPSMYQVLLLNDDYTPMEFVIYILERFFNKSKEEATTIMLHVHKKGVGVCGVFPYEIAESKVSQVMDFCLKNEQPLQCILEKA